MQPTMILGMQNVMKGKIYLRLSRYLILVPALFFLKCANNDKRQTIQLGEPKTIGKGNDLNYKILNTFIINLDSLTPIEEIRIFINRKENKVSIVNFINQSIDYYDLATGNLIFRCQIFEHESKYIKIANGIQRANGFLFLTKPNLNNSFMVDDSCNNIKGNIISNAYAFTDDVNSIINVDNGSWGGPVLKNNNIYFINLPFIDPKSDWETRKRYLYERKYSMNESKLSSIPIIQPETYKNINLHNYNLIPFRAFNKDSNLFVYSWPSSNIISIYNISDETVNNREIISPSIAPSNIPVSEEPEINVALKSVMFGSIFYDNVHKVYYRFVLHPFVPDVLIRPLYLNIFNKPIIIQVLNDKLEELGIVVINEKYIYTKTLVQDGHLFLVKNWLNKGEDHLIIDEIEIIL